MANFVYTAVDHPLAVYGTFPTDINSSGQVIGYYQDGDYASHYFIYDSDTQVFTDLEYPGSDRTYLEDISDFGQVVGSYFNAGAGWDEFINFVYDYEAGTYQSIESPFGVGLRGINAAGVMVGNTLSGGVIYENGVFTSYPSGIYFYDINDNGEVLGAYLGIWILYDLATDTFTALDLPFGNALAINDSGEFLGEFYYDLGSQSVGMVYDNSTGTGIFARHPDAEFSSTSFQGLSDNDQIVGFYLDSVGTGFGFIGTLDSTLPEEPQSTLPVAAGGTATISTEFLLSTDNLSGPEGLTYTILAAPNHGTLLLDGVETSTFEG